MKKKLKHILKYILTYSTIAILGATLFFTNLIANVYADENNDIYRLFDGATCVLRKQSNYSEVARDVLTEQDVTNINSIDIGIMPNIYDYIINTQQQDHYYLTITLTNSINAPLWIHFDGSPSTPAQDITLYNNDTQIGYFINDVYNESLVDNGEKFYNEIVISGIYLPDYYNQYFVYSYDYISYMQGYNDAIGKYLIEVNNYDDLESQYNALLNQYATLNQQYTTLANGEYTFENLFWSIGSVPMAFLLQSFNVNVLGLNMAAIITGLITALVVIWAIKKLLK